MFIQNTISQSAPSYPYYQNSEIISSTVNEKEKCMMAEPYLSLIRYTEAATGQVLSESDKKMIVDNTKFKKFRKRQYFLHEGDVCNYIGFIAKGSSRMFSINERGQESIISFGMENAWIADQGSFKNSIISKLNIELLEDTTLILMTKQQMEYLTGKVPALNIMFGQHHVEQLIDTQKRINAALSMTAHERYADLMDCRPEYLQRFSQNMLACYLGMTPETLSRIRRR